MKDLPLLYAIYNKRENMQFISSGKWSWTEEELMGKLGDNNTNYLNGYGIYIVVLKEGNHVIGEAGLFDSFQDADHVLEMGYILDCSYWGKGLGTERLLGLIDYGFKRLHLTKLVARMHEQNQSSVQLAEKCGMKLTEEGKTGQGIAFRRYEIGNLKT